MIKIETIARIKKDLKKNDSVVYPMMKLNKEDIEILNKFGY